MNEFFNPIISTCTHYYNIFSFEYDDHLQKQANEAKKVRRELYENLPNSIKKTCTKLVNLLKKENIPLTNEEMVEQCRSYFKIVHMPEIKVAQNFYNIDIPDIIHTGFSRAIDSEEKCNNACTEFNAKEFDFQRFFMGMKKNLKLVNEIIIVRRVVFSLISLGLTFAAYKSFKKAHKREAAALAGAAALIAMISILFAGTIQTPADLLKDS